MSQLKRLRILAVIALVASLMATLSPTVALAHPGHDHGGQGGHDEGILDPGGAPPAGSGPIDIEGFVRAIDGDTMETWINGSRVGIGLIGVDVFEANTVCGAAAADALQYMLFTGIHLEEDDEIVFDDRMRRMYYVYTPDGQSIAHALVASGMARASGEGRDAAELLALEEAARQSGAGCVWDEGAGDILEPGAADLEPTADFAGRSLLALPSNFQAVPVVSGLNFPTDFDFLPDGRILAAEKSGIVRIAVDGSVLATPFIDLRAQVNDYWDRGLLSVAVDPNFESNGYVYFLFTYEHDPSDYSGPKTARLIRVTANGNTADPATAVTILGSVVGDSCDDFPAGADCIPSDGPSHSGGGMEFAPDGTLFITLGEGANFNASTPQALRAQDMKSLGGKLVRITTDGKGLPDNPFWTGNPDDVESKIWALGFRNAYRFSLHPDDGTPYVGDVGWVSWEEVNVARAGANLGWPCYEGALIQSAYSSYGPCQDLYAAGNATAPIITWDHTTGGSAVTGGVFYTAVGYPEEYRGAYFYGDYARNFIRYAHMTADHEVASGPFSFDEAAGGPVDFEIGPEGDLYYLSITTGEVRRIVYNENPPGSESGFVSDLPWASSTNGWGPAERDMSNGEQDAGDGGPLTINGATFAKGVGVHAPSEIVINLDGTCSQFISVVGIDDEVGDNGSVVFEVYSGDELLASSGVVTGADDPQTMTVNLAGVTQLRLVVTDAGDNTHWDHADWADAWIECGQDQTPPAIVTTSPADGATGVSISASIMAIFTEPLDPASLSGSVELLDADNAPVDAEVSFSAETATLTIKPDASLAVSTTYTVRIAGGPDGVRDLAGNPLAEDYAWSFTTAATAGPQPVITSPLPTDTFIVGDTFTYAGGAFDANGDPLPASTLRWRVLIHHCNHIDCHTHQVIDQTGTTGGQITVPDHGDQYYFEVRLTATHAGQSNTTTVEIYPRTVDVTLQTIPAGLEINLAGEQAVAPLTRPIVIGSVITVAAPTPQGDYAFQSWSDGGARVHTVQIGEEDVTLTAVFSDGEPGGEIYLSDLTPTVSYNHWGPAEMDMSNGEDGAGDGGPLTIGGVIYPKGIGVHAPSTIVYSIDGCSLLLASIGVDDEVGDNGSVVFEVRGDEQTLYRSDVLTGADAAVDIAVDITGFSYIQLRVEDAGDNVYWDHADWGNARIVCGDPASDDVPPTVATVAPADGEIGVELDTVVTATFDEPIDPDTLAGNFTLAVLGGAPVAASVSYDDMTNRAILTPSADLLPNTTYRATVIGGSGGVTDEAGNPLLDDVSWTFSTAQGEPGASVIYISDMTWLSATNGWGPVERDMSNGEQSGGDGGPLTIGGVTFEKGLGVHPWSEIVVALDGSCVTFAAMVGVDVEVGDNGSVVFQVYADGTLLYTSPVLTGGQAPHPVQVDLDGHDELALVVTDGGDNDWWDHADWGDARLICGEPPAGDTTAPEVTSTVPANGATGVPVDAAISATFSEAINPATLSGAVSLQAVGGGPVAANIAYDAATLTVTITPDDGLSTGTEYLVTLGTGIADLAGNQLAGDVTWSFTTADDAPPTGLLAAPYKIAAGTNAHGVSAADMDGDGNLDLVVATTEANAVVVLFGDGDGGFVAGGSYATGVHPKFATVADLNGDGNLDFVSANQDDAGGNDVSVYLGDGAGAFTLAGHFEACANPHEVAAGDFDEDGNPDLAVVCWGGSVASVLFGNGDGTFGAPTDLSVGSAPHSVVVADLNGDGNLDIATADHNSNTVSILLGRGNGTFQNRRTTAVGGGPHSMRAGDLNGDGIIDLVTANDSGDTVSVLLGRGSGTFDRADYAVGDEPKGVALGDVNGDGRLDIVSANIHGTYPCCGGDTSITVLLNDGAGTFNAVREDYDVVSSPFSVATGDFNGDGRLDVASANWHTHDVAIFLGRQ